MNIDKILESQRAFFRSGATLPVKFRVEMLKKLYNAVKKYEKDNPEILDSVLSREYL